MTKDKLLEALPLFIGALLGVWLYYASLSVVAAAGLVLGLGLMGHVAMSAGGALMARHPIRAVQVWQAEVLLPIALIGAGGYVSTWIVDHLPALVPLIFPDPGPAATGAADAAAAATAAERVKTISATLSTAVTAFLGALFMDDQKDKDGGFWPAAQIRKSMREAFSARVDQMKAALERRAGEDEATFLARFQANAPAFELASRAIHSPDITIEHPEGWSYSGARARAGLIETLILGR